MMADRTITLHIGASKCGSSALQSALTAYPTVYNHNGQELNYAVVNTKSKVLDKYHVSCGVGPHGYKASPSAEQILRLDLGSLRKQILHYPTELILSSEGWLFEPKRWEKLLKELGVDAKVIVYVRPQVPVLNSAWWQWGAWSDEEFDGWMANRLKASLWGERVKRWASIKGISDLIVRPVPSDIVKDFYSTVLNAVEPENVSRPNTSLPATVLRLFQRNRSLRPSIHDSKIDFILSNLITCDEPSIWVLNEQWIHKILENTRSDNEALTEFMDSESAACVKKDPRWWHADAFSDKIAENPNPQQIDVVKLERLCVQLAKAVFDLKAK